MIGNLIFGHNRLCGDLFTVISGLVHAEGLVDVLGNLVTANFRAHYGKVLGVCHEANLNEDGGHGGAPEHPERVLGHSPVGFDGASLHGRSYVRCKLQALAKVGVLHEGEDDGRRRVIWVEALICGLVVLLKLDYGVFPLYKVQVLGIEVITLPLGLAQAVDGVAVGGGGAVYGVHMHGNKEVCARLVCKHCAVFQLNKAVVGAGHLHLNIRI